MWWQLAHSMVDFSRFNMYLLYIGKSQQASERIALPFFRICPAHKCPLTIVIPSAAPSAATPRPPHACNTDVLLCVCAPHPAFECFCSCHEVIVPFLLLLTGHKHSFLISDSNQVAYPVITISKDFVGKCLRRRKIRND
uniref:Uncharacterized protein n=1 Tax=Setaria italica TaxID=4555 RepID=K3ZXY4_SETIT